MDCIPVPSLLTIQRNAGVGVSMDSWAVVLLTTLEMNLMSYWVENAGFLKLLLYCRVFLTRNTGKVSDENRHPIERIFSDEFSIAQCKNPYDQTSFIQFTGVFY